MHDPGLASGLGHDPSRERGDETQRRADHERAQHQPIRFQLAADPAPHAPGAEQQEQEAQRHHHAGSRRTPAAPAAASPDATDFRPCTSPSSSCVRIRLASFGIAISKWFSCALLIGNREQQQRRAARGLPQSFHRRDLDRLVFARVEAVDVADHDLQIGAATASTLMAVRRPASPAPRYTSFHRHQAEPPATTRAKW
jgi:hypothetical protein